MSCSGLVDVLVNGPISKDDVSRGFNDCRFRKIDKLPAYARTCPSKVEIRKCDRPVQRNVVGIDRACVVVVIQATAATYTTIDLKVQREN